VIQDNPQRKGHRFVNPWPSIERHGFHDALKWMIGRRARRSPNSSRTLSLPAATSAFAMPRAAPGDLSATWVGHTTVLLQIGGLNILTDPIWSRRASPVSFAGPKRHSPPGLAFDALPIIDVILISHNHYDHFDSDSIRRLVARFPAAAWRVPIGLARSLLHYGATDVREMTWHDLNEFAGAQIRCVPAQHFSGRGLLDRDRTLWCGWVVRAKSRAVFFAGDTGFNPSFGQIGSDYGPFDLALLPIGAYDPRWFMRPVHMDPEEAVAAAGMLAGSLPEPPSVLATHWGTFKLTDEPLSEPPVRMQRAWAEAGFPPKRLWILAPGETRSP
jgi:Predicted Zn-dependent hydrolases of the beta-lactamase fold